MYGLSPAHWQWILETVVGPHQGMLCQSVPFRFTRHWKEQRVFRCGSLLRSTARDPTQRSREYQRGGRGQQSPCESRSGKL